MHVRHVLHLQRCKDDAANHCQPCGRCFIEVMKSISGGHLHGAGAIAYVAEAVKQISHHDAVISAPQIIVHPSPDHQRDRFPGPSELQRGKIDGRDH